MAARPGDFPDVAEDPDNRHRSSTVQRWLQEFPTTEDRPAHFPKWRQQR
jgi:hypothetical protein